MPLPGVYDVHVNIPLTNLSEAIIQAEDRFIEDEVFPVVPVPNKSNLYYIFRYGDFYRTDAIQRAPGSETPAVGYALQTDTYVCVPWGVHFDIDDQIRSNADSILDLDMAATRRCILDLLIRRETDWASNFFTTGKWTGSSTGSDITPAATWDLVNSTPIEDIRAQTYAVIQATGLDPQVFVAGALTHKRLVDHPDIIDRIKYTQRGIVTEDLLAAFFEVDKYLVLKAIKATNQEVPAQPKTGTTTTGGPAVATSFIAGGKNALLVYSPSAPGLMVPASGYNFAWTGYLGANAYGGVIRKFRMEALRSDRVEAEIAFAHKQVAAILGVFFSNAVAS
jgi:Phage major capsid protein E